MVFKLQDSEKIGDFSSLILLPGWNYKIRNIIADLQDIPNLIKEYHLSTILKVESSRKRHCSTLIWPQGAKWKFWIHTAHLQDVPNHILEHQFSVPENVDVVQVTKFTEKSKCHVLTLIWLLGIKWKLWNLIGNLKDILNHILEYHLSIL